VERKKATTQDPGQKVQNEAKSFHDFKPRSARQSWSRSVVIDESEEGQRRKKKYS
jgi:hypothetical protein